LDVERRILQTHNEEGLLALAFHPDYARNGLLFVWHTMDGPRRNVLARYRVSRQDPDRADPSSRAVLLEVEKPYGNHNGATLAFGPDGFLYVSVGDGG